MYYSFLEKLTIVIYSFNRHKYLIRTLKYWSNFNAKVLVLDGSKEKLENDCLCAKNIKYIHDPRSLYDRLKSSSKYIDTKFMILGCDDEFYLPSALSSCIKFLIMEPSYSTCGGRVLGFQKNIYGNLSCREIYKKLKDLNLSDNCPIKRIENHFSNYEVAHVYSVIRSEIWSKICKYVFTKEYNLYSASELQIEFLLPVSGKTKIISELMTMRNLEVAPIRGTSPSLNISNGKLKWWFEKNKSEERLDFFFRMNKIVEKLLIDKENKFNENEVARLFEILFNKIYLQKKKMIKINLLKSLIIPSIIKVLIKFFIKKLKIIEILNKIKFFRYKILSKKLINQTRLLESQGVLINYMDLDNIRSILENFKIRNK